MIVIMAGPARPLMTVVMRSRVPDAACLIVEAVEPNKGEQP